MHLTFLFQRNLTEYYNAVDCDNMIRIFASMLYERRIVFTSKRLYRLSACVQAANAIIYPMNWQHIFIPVLPTHLVDYLLAPMPYLIGVPNTLLDVRLLFNYFYYEKKSTLEVWAVPRLVAMASNRTKICDSNVKNKLD